jgi:geranylgeranyl diphosphate synthase, type II
MLNLEAIIQRISGEIARLELKGSPAELYEPIEYVLSLGGKRLRPALVLMACDLFGGDTGKAISPALGIEVFHNFTLLHDDIMDNAPLRRSSPTVHEKWNPNIAILSGDAMFVRSWQLMMQVDDAVLREVLSIFSRSAIEVCEGQQMDMNFEQRTDVTIEEYERMIELKTAVLLAASLKIGALVGGASAADSEKIYDFGRNMGVAFQLQDDILDVYGEKEKFGKKVGGDIVSNKKTFLLLKAMELAEGEMQEALGFLTGPDSITLPSEEKVSAVTGIYDALDIKMLASQEVKRYFDEALHSLNALSVPEERKQVMRSFADGLMNRQF